MNRLRATLRELGRAVRFAWKSSTRQWREPHHPDIPTQRFGPKMFTGVFLDELALALMPRVDSDLSVADLSRAREELDEALSILESNDCLDDPASFHPAPPPIDSPIIEPQKKGPVRFEVLKFDSGYQAFPGLPGTHRWLTMESNKHAYAYLLHHRDGPRPWVMNLHPFGAGGVGDFLHMRALRLHRKLGYNVLHPVFPLHGDRRPDPLDPNCTILNYDLLNTVHFFSQAVWDLRRLLNWVRSQGATSISVHGISLGAYVSTLIAGLEPIDRVIVGLGAANLPAARAYQLGDDERKSLSDYGLLGGPSDVLFSVISPLKLGCLVPHENRFVYGGLGDRFAPGGTYDIWEALDRPSVHWHAGGHLTGTIAPSVWRYIFEALSTEGPGASGKVAQNSPKRLKVS